MVAQTFVSLHLYGYGTAMLATIQKYSPQMGVYHVPLQDFTMDLVLTMYMTTEGMEVQLARSARDSLTTWQSVSPPPSGPFPRIPSRHSSLLHGRAKTDRLD